MKRFRWILFWAYVICAVLISLYDLCRPYNGASVLIGLWCLIMTATAASVILANWAMNRRGHQAQPKA